MEIDIRTKHLLTYLIKNDILKVKRKNDILWIPKYLHMEIKGNVAFLTTSFNISESFVIGADGQPILIEAKEQLRPTVKDTEREHEPEQRKTERKPDSVKKQTAPVNKSVVVRKRGLI